MINQNPIEQYLEELFRGQDSSQKAVADAKSEAREKLTKLYEASRLLADAPDPIPLSPEEKREARILSLVKQEFGKKEAIRSMILHRELEMEYQEFMEGFERKIKAGVAAILLIPIVFLVLMFTQDSKPVFLTMWIASILAIAAYLIGLEYKKFGYERRLEIRVIRQDAEEKQEESQMKEAKTNEAQPSETQPSEEQPSEAQTNEAQTNEAQPSEVQPSEVQPDNREDPSHASGITDTGAEAEISTTKEAGEE